MAHATLRSDADVRLTADELLRTIRRLYQALRALPQPPAHGHGSPAYVATVAEIRVYADRYRAITEVAS